MQQSDGQSMTKSQSIINSVKTSISQIDSGIVPSISFASIANDSVCRGSKNGGFPVRLSHQTERNQSFSPGRPPVRTKSF